MNDKKAEDAKPIGHVATKAAEGKIFICRAVMPPFKRWQDTISLDETHLIITRRQLGFRKRIPIKLEDLLNVEILEVPIFATLRITAKFLSFATTNGEQGHEDVTYLLKKDAKVFQRMALEAAESKTNPDSSGGQ